MKGVGYRNVAGHADRLVIACIIVMKKIITPYLVV